MADEGGQILWKARECIVTALQEDCLANFRHTWQSVLEKYSTYLEAMNETQQQRPVHPAASLVQNLLNRVTGQ